MQSFDWKSLYRLCGSNRGFLERVRTPDEQFRSVLLTLQILFPILFGFLVISFALMPMLTEAFLGSESPVTRIFHSVAFYALKLTTYAFVLAFVGMYGLRGYVYWKLRRQKRSG